LLELLQEFSHLKAVLADSIGGKVLILFVSLLEPSYLSISGLASALRTKANLFVPRVV